MLTQNNPRTSIEFKDGFDLGVGILGRGLVGVGVCVTTGGSDRLQLNGTLKRHTRLIQVVPGTDFRWITGLRRVIFRVRTSTLHTMDPTEVFLFFQTPRTTS